MKKQENIKKAKKLLDEVISCNLDLGGINNDKFERLCYATGELSVLLSKLKKDGRRNNKNNSRD